MHEIMNIKLIEHFCRILSSWTRCINIWSILSKISRKGMKSFEVKLVKKILSVKSFFLPKYIRFHFLLMLRHCRQQFSMDTGISRYSKQVCCMPNTSTGVKSFSSFVSISCSLWFFMCVFTHLKTRRWKNEHKFLHLLTSWNTDTVI